MKFYDGSYYKGQFKDGNMHGFGEMELETGKYKGNFYNNLYSGKGTFIWESGTKYVGDWNNNLQNGKGTLVIYSSSNSRIRLGKYNGGFKNGDKDGQGVLDMCNGDYYDGSWKLGVKYG